MPTYVPLNTKDHASKRWKRPVSHAFAQQDITAPIVGPEFPQAVAAFPIAFFVRQETVSPVVLLGFEQGQNLFVDQSGHWLGSYTPMVMRVHPFKLARTDSGQMILCVDQDSELISDDQGEPFFDAGGGPSPAVKAIMELLNHLQAGQAATTTACAALARHGVLKPWPLTVKAPSGPIKLDGLFQIDEQALNTIADDAFLELRRAGALPMAYCQLLSMMRVPSLERLAALKMRKTSQAPTPPADMPKLSLADDMFRFG